MPIDSTSLISILSTPELVETAKCILGGIGVKKLYDDFASPTIKEAGALGARVFSALVVSADIWAENRKKRFQQLQDDVATNLKNKNQEDIVEKVPEYILVPALTSYMYSMDKKELRSMYAKLISRALLKENTDKIHPAFTTIIQNLTPNECLLLEYLSSEGMIPILNTTCSKKEVAGFSLRLINQYLYPSNITIHSAGPNISNKIFTNFVLGSPAYISNLNRLGVIDITYMEFFSNETQYDTILNRPELQQDKLSCERQNLRFDIQKGILRVSPLGKEFASFCIADI